MKNISSHKKSVDELRSYYLKHPPEGMSRSDIRSMSDEDLLDMDYFLNEDLDDIFGEAEDGFFIF